MEIQGKCISILEPARFVSKRNGNEIVKTTFVVETSGQYPKKVAFSVIGVDRFSNMGLVVGGSYSVSFDVESREWGGKWFTDLSAWRATRLDGVAQQQGVQAQVPQSPTTPTNNDDDAPF